MSDPQDDSLRPWLFRQGAFGDPSANNWDRDAASYQVNGISRSNPRAFHASVSSYALPLGTYSVPGQIDYSQPDLQQRGRTFEGSSPDASLANKNQLNYSSYVTEATYGGKSMYGNTARGENAQFGPPRLGFESKSYYTTNEQGDKVGNRPLVTTIDFNNRGGYSVDGGGYTPRPGHVDPFTTLTNAYIGGQITTDQYAQRKASLNRTAAAPLYSGWRTPMKDSKRMLQPPVATGIRNAFTGSERTPATDAFPDKNAYIPDAADQAEYYTGIQEGLKADREKRQSQTRFSVQMDRSVGRAYGVQEPGAIDPVTGQRGTLSRKQGPSNPRGRQAPDAPYQIPEEDRDELKPYFWQAGVALARNTAASVGSTGGKLSHSTLGLVQMAQNLGNRYGVQQEDYAGGIRQLSGAVGSTHTTESLITASLQHGVFTEAEQDTLTTNGAPDPQKIAGYAQAQNYIAISRGASPTDYHNQLAEFATIRALNNGTYATFHPNAEAGAKAQEKYGPIVKTIESARSMTEVGSAMKWEKPGPVQGASDHKGDNAETAGGDSETPFQVGMHVSAFTDDQNPQSALAKETSMEVAEAFSTLDEGLRAKAAGANIGDFQRTQLGFSHGVNTRTRTAPLLPGGIVTREGMRDGDFGAQQTTTALSPVALSARKLATLADQRGRGLSLRAIGNYETDSIVGAAMAGTTEMPNSNALLRTARAGSGKINGLPATASGARQLARQTGQFRREQQEMIDRAAAGGDIDEYEAFDYNKDSDADPSTAQQALGNRDYGIVDAFGTMGGFQPDPFAIALRQGMSASGIPTNRKEAALFGSGRRGEQLDLGEVADMLVQARGATVNNDPTNKDNSGDVLEPLYANGKSLVDILTQNPTDAPVFTERLSAPARVTPEQLAAETRSNLNAFLPEYQDTMHPAVYGRIKQRLEAKNDDGSDAYELKDIISLQGEGHVNLMLRGGTFTGSGVQGERSNQAQMVEELVKRSGDTARRTLNESSYESGGIDYDTLVQNDLRQRAANAGDRDLRDVYGVADLDLAKVMHHVGSSSEGTLRENMTAGLLGQLTTDNKVKPEYADITRRVYDKRKKTNEVALDLLTPGDKAWMGEARDMSRQLAKGFGDPTKLRETVVAGGVNPGLIDELGHEAFGDYLQGQQVIHAATRTGDLRGYQSFLDEHGKALDIKRDFSNEREFSDWLGGTAKSGAFIQGVGNPDDVMADRTRNSRAFLERVGMLADTGNISNEGLSGEMRTPKLSNNPGMADENVSGTKVSIKDITTEHEDRARRVQASIDVAKAKQVELRAAKKNLVDNHLEMLQSMGIKDPLTRNVKLQAAYEKKFHRMLGGLAEGMTEQQFQSNPSAKAMRAAIGFYDARTAAFNTSDALKQTPITAAPDGRRILDTLNNKDQKNQLAEFMEVGVSRLAQQNRGTPMQGSDNKNDYTMSRIREDFMGTLKGGTAQQAQARLKKLMDLHDEWRNGDQRNGQPVFTEDHALRLADALGARKDFVGLNFGAPKARRDQDNNFIFGNVQENDDHRTKVQSMVRQGLGMTKGAASAKMPVGMDAYSAAKYYHDTVFRSNAGQRNVMNANPNGLTVVNAGQGTGKTAANIAFLAQQASQMREGDPQVLALSFSKPAEREVSKKLDAQLDAESRSRIRAATVDADALKVYTASKGVDKIKPLDSVEKQMPYMRAAMRNMKVGTSEAPGELLNRVNSLVQEGFVGDQYLKHLDEHRPVAPNYDGMSDEESAKARTHYERVLASHTQNLVAGHALMGLHAEYDKAGVADFDTMKVAAAQALQRNDKIREQFQPHNTTGTVDESQDTRKSDLAYIKARFGKGLVAIGDNGQNLGADYRETVLNVGTELKKDWQGTVNPDVELTQSMRQGSAMVTATNALLGQQNVGDATPGREGQFSYTSYTHKAGLSGEIEGQVGLFHEMLKDTPDMLDGKTVSFITPTDRGRTAIKKELRAKGIPYMTGTGLDDEGNAYTAEQQRGRVIADTIHGVKGQTHDVTFGIGFGEGDMNLTLGGAAVPSPEEIQAAVAGGDASPGGRGMLQKAFMGNVAMGRSNTVHMSGSGAPSKLIEPAMDALEALKPGAALHRDYTPSEAIPASRGADRTNPRDIATINADNLLMAGQTNRDTALTTDLGMLMPKDMQLAKGADAFMAEQARRTLSETPAMLQSFVEANKDRQPLDLPSVDMTWETLQRTLRGEQTATTDAFALGGKMKDENLVGGNYEVHLTDRNYVGGPEKLPTGITLNFGDQATQKPRSSFDELTPGDLAAAGGQSTDELKASFDAGYGPGSFNRQGVPTGFRSQKFGDTKDTKPDAAFLNRFTVSGISDTAAAFAMGGGLDSPVDSPNLPTSKLRPRIPDMPQTPHGMDTTRGATAIDTRYLFSGSMGEADNPWRNAMEGHIRGIQQNDSNKSMFQVKEGIGGVHVVSDPEQYAAMVQRGAHGIDVTQEAWANPDIPEEQIAALDNGRGKQHLVARRIGTSIGKGETGDLFKQIGSTLGRGQNVAILAPTAESESTLQTAFHVMGVAKNNKAASIDPSLLWQPTNQSTVQREVMGQPYAQMNSGVAGDDGIGQRQITDNNYVLGITGPKGGDDFTRKDWEAAYMGTQALLKKRKTETEANGQSLRVRTGGTAGMDMLAGDLAMSMKLPLDLQLPAHPDDMAEMQNMSRADQSRLHQHIDYALKNGGSVSVNNRQVTRDSDGKITTDSRALEVGQQGMIVANGGRMADEVATYWNGQERGAGALQQAAALQIPITNLSHVGQGATLPAASPDTVKLGLEAAANSSRMTSTQEIKKLEPIESLNQSQAYAERIKQRPGREEPPELPVEAYVLPSKGIPETEGASYTPPPEPPNENIRRRINEPAPDNGAAKFIRQAASLIPHADKLLTGGVHLASQDEALAEAQKRFGKDATPLRGWSDPKNNAVYVADQSHLGAEGNAMMAHTVAHEAGHIAIAQARRSDKGEANYQAAVAAFENGPQGNIPSVYKGRARANEGLADLFAQSVGARDFAGDPRAYHEPQAKHSRFSMNPEFAMKGLQALNSVVARFPKAFDKAFNAWIPKTAALTKTGDELVKKVQGLPEANLPTERPTGEGSVGPAQYQHEELDDLPDEGYLDAIGAVKAKQKTARGAQPFTLTPAAEKLPKLIDQALEGVSRPAQNDASAKALMAQALAPTTAAEAFNGYTPPDEGYADHDVRPDTNAAKVAQFSGNVVMGMEDFGNFVEGANQNKQVSSFHGLAAMPEGGGDLSVSRFSVRGSGTMQEGSRNRTDSNRYVFGRAEADRNSTKEAEVLSVGIPGEDEVNPGVGIHYNPAEGKIAASYGGEQAKLMVQHGDQLLTAEQALGMRKAPIAGAATERPGNVAPDAVKGNAYTPIANDYMTKASPDQRAFMDAPTHERIVANSDAGGGKTFALLGRVANLFKRGIRPSQTSYVSFMNAPAEDFDKKLHATFKDPKLYEGMHVRTASALARDVVRASDPGFLKTVFGKDFDPKTAKTLSSGNYLRANDPDTGMPAEHIEGDKGHHPGDDVMMMWDTMQKGHWDALPAEARNEITAQAKHEFKFGQYSNELDSVKTARYLRDQNNKILQGKRFGQEQVEALEQMQGAGEDVTPGQMGIAKMSAAFQREQGANNRIGQEETALAAYQSLQKPANSIQNNPAMRDLASQFEHTIVDEGQDMSEIQTSMIDHLSAGRGMSIAGDKKQRILGFRGAAKDFIKSFSKTFKLDKEFRFQTSRRNKQSILDTVNAAFDTATEPTADNKGKGRVSYNHTGMYGQAGWEEENKRMASDILSDLQHGGNIQHNAEETMIGVPTHARLEHLEGLLAEPLDRLGVGIKKMRNPEQLDQDALNMVGMKDKPDPTQDQDAYAKYDAARQVVQQRYESQRGVSLGILHQFKGLEKKRAYMGGYGEGSGQIVPSQLAKRLGKPGQETEDPEVLEQYQDAKNLGYVSATRPKDQLRMYGSGAPARFLSRAASVLGLDRYARNIAEGDTAPISGAGTAASVSPPRKDMDMTPRTAVQQAVAVNKVLNPEALPADALIAPPQSNFGPQPLPTVTPAQKRALHLGRSAEFYQGMSPEEAAETRQGMEADIQASAGRRIVLPNEPAAVSAYHIAAQATGHELNNLRETPGGVTADVRTASTATTSGKAGQSNAAGVEMPGGSGGAHIQDVRVTNAGDIAEGVAKALPQAVQQMLKLPEGAAKEYFSQQGPQGQMAAASAIGAAGSAGLLTPEVQAALAPHIAGLTAAARAQGSISEVIPGLNRGNYDVANETFRAPRVGGASGGGSVPRADFAIGGGDDDGGKGTSAYALMAKNVRGGLNALHQFGTKEGNIYEADLKTGSEYDFLATRAAQATGQTRSQVDAANLQLSQTKGISRIDAAQVQRFISDPQQAQQVAEFAKMGGMDPGTAARDTRQLGTQFNIRADQAANIISASRNSGGTLDEKDLLQAAQATAPFAYRSDGANGGQRLSGVLAMSQALGDAGIDVDRGTRQLYQHMAMPDVVMATRLKQVHDHNGRTANPNATQQELDSTFTSETYWNDQNQVAQMHNQVVTAPLRLTEMRSQMGLDANGISRFQASPTSNGSYAQQVMGAPLSSLSNAALDTRMQRTNIDAEARNLSRQGGILDIQERMQGRQIQQEQMGLNVQGMQIAQGREMLGVKQEQFGLQKQQNQIDLSTNKLDIASMQVRGKYAQEQSDLSYDKSNIEYRSRTRDLELEKRMLPAKQKQLDVQIQSQEVSFQYQKEGIEFQRWYDTQMNGSVGADRSYRSYLAMQGGQANEQREGGTGSTAQASNYNQTKAQVAATPVMGLKNEQFYAGIEHQMAQLTLGRSNFRSEASFAENVSYLKKQTDMYERQMAIEDKARAFSYRMQDKQLALAEAQWQVQKELLKFQKEQLNNQIADAEKLIPIEERLNDINHEIEKADIKQMPERIALAMAGLLLKEKGVALSEKATSLSLAQEAKMLAAQGAQLALAQAALGDQKKLNDLTNAARRDELETAKKNLAVREELQKRDEALLSVRALQAEEEYKLTARIAEISAYMEISHNAIKDKGIGTENGQVMDFSEFAKSIAAMIKSGELDPKVAERMTQSWTDPAMVAAVRAAMDGSLEKYEKSGNTAAATEANRKPGEQSAIDKSYTDIAKTGGFDEAEWLKTISDTQIAMKHASDSTNDTVNAMEKLKGAVGDLLGPLHGLAGQVGDMSGAVLSIINVATAFKLAGGAAGTAAVAGGTAATVAGEAAVGTVAAGGTAAAGGLTAAMILPLVAVVVGAGAIAVIMQEVSGWMQGQGGGAISNWLQDKIMGKDKDGNVAYDGSGAGAQALTQYSAQHSMTAPEIAAMKSQLADYEKFQKDPSTGNADEMHQFEANYPELIALLKANQGTPRGGISPDERDDASRGRSGGMSPDERQDHSADKIIAAAKDNATATNATLKTIDTGIDGQMKRAIEDSKTLGGVAKSTLDTADSIKAENKEILAAHKTAMEIQKGQAAVTKATDGVAAGNARLLTAHATMIERLDAIHTVGVRTADGIDKGFQDLMKSLVKGAEDLLGKGAGSTPTPKGTPGAPAPVAQPGGTKGGSDGSTPPPSVPTKPRGGRIPEYAIGTKNVPEDQFAFIHRGEAVLTTNEAAAYRAGADVNTGLPGEMKGIVDGILASGMTQGSDFHDAAQNLPSDTAPHEAQAPANLPSSKGDTYHINVTQSLSGDISPAMAEKIKKGTIDAVTEAVKKTIKR